MARNIADALTRLRPAGADRFEQNLASFTAEMDTRYAEWKKRMAPYRHAHIVAYHNQWPYFEEAFDLIIADFLEPKPGIPPTPSQLASTIRHMQQDNMKIIIIAPYYKQDAADLVVRRLDGVVVPLASSVGAYEGVDSIFDLFEFNVNANDRSFKATTN